MSGYRPRPASTRPNSFSTYEYDLQQANITEAPLLPNRTFGNMEIDVLPYTPPGPNRTHRPRYLSLKSEDSGYTKVDPFDPNTLYAPPRQYPRSPGHNNTPMSDDQFIQPTPSPGGFGLPNPKPPSPHPFAQNFEPPQWRRIGLHIFVVALAYPALLIFVIIAREKTLFWSRAIISIGCGVIGFSLGLSLISLGRPFLEAATWATIIHQSHMNDAPGVRLRDLAATSQDPTSAFSALRLLWTRAMYPGTTRKNRKRYDGRPWSLAIAFFLILIILAASLPFVLGRIVSIQTNVSHQRVDYYEIVVKGDLTTDDIERGSALTRTFDTFAITWTLSPFSTHGSLPPAISYSWDGDMVYFSEAVSSQFIEGGSGFGTFKDETTNPSIDTEDTLQFAASAAVEPGALLRYPRWGIRIHCERLPDPTLNLVTKSPNGFTYIWTPRSMLESLYSSFNQDLPTSLEATVDTTRVLLLNDTIPSGMNIDDYSLGAAFYDNGVAHSMRSDPISMGDEGTGWVSIESVLVRLNTTYAPNGTFPLYSAEAIPDQTGNDTYIGYDAAVCLELYEPYILETYNSTVGLPSTIGIIGRNNFVMNAPTPDGEKEKRKGPSLTDSTVKTHLNSTGLSQVYNVLHGNSVNQLVKDNGRDSYYVPNPTLVSYTDSSGPYGYTELSPEYFAQARALADASNILPYFAGSGDTLARMYPDLVLASTSIHKGYMVALVITVLGMGIIAGLFVPMLPYGVPHRGFEVYSWLAAFQGEELVGTYLGNTMPKNMNLKEIEEKMGDLKFCYGF